MLQLYQSYPIYLDSSIKSNNIFSYRGFCVVQNGWDLFNLFTREWMLLNKTSIIISMPTLQSECPVHWMNIGSHSCLNSASKYYAFYNVTTLYAESFCQCCERIITVEYTGPFVIMCPCGTGFIASCRWRRIRVPIKVSAFNKPRRTQSWATIPI